MILLQILDEKTYCEIFNQDEAWFMFSNGSAVLLLDLPIWDS